MDQLQVPFKFICQVLTMGTKYLSLENTHLLHLRQTQYVSRLVEYHKKILQTFAILCRYEGIAKICKKFRQTLAEENIAAKRARYMSVLSCR